jgi:serine/threonine protein kinase
MGVPLEMASSTRIGTEVAGFRIESVLGRGGMSVVYVAEQLRLGRRVALKVLTTELAWDEQFRERFVRESHIAAAIDHPNIIPIYDAGEEDGLLYIAMRFVQGPDLKEVLKRGSLGVGRTIFLIEQLASALDAAHTHALVHRDVKPGNILLEESTDHVYLTDFGSRSHIDGTLPRHRRVRGARADRGSTCRRADRCVCAGLCALRVLDGDAAVLAEHRACRAARAPR